MKRVAVLMGGMSVEREVSLVSGAACADALERRGYAVTRIDPDPDLAAVLAADRPDAVFNALHGRLGEDGRVQGLLDWMRLPYTHSGVLASAVAMDKPMACRLFEAAGLRCPEGRALRLGDLLDHGPPIKGPIVVKPAAEGSSVGVAVLPDGDLDPLRRRNDLDLHQRVMVERYVPGRELTVAVLNGEPLTVTEIAPAEGFYDYRAKYTEGYAAHRLPAVLPAEVFAAALNAAKKAHESLGCRGVSRADFRYDAYSGNEGLYILEVNTQPGMTPLSLVPEQAQHRGIGFDDLVVRLIEEARCDS